MRNAYNILVRKRKAVDHFKRLRRGWKGNNKVYLKKVRRGDVN